ncbi:MAG TPA: hypothetical protein VGJ74_09185 [Burkholderiales bacterium]|jgi:hypothetical protein
MKKWLCVLLVAGCSSAQWDKPGATTASVDADLRACNAAAQAVPGLPSPRTTSNSVEVRSAPTGVGVQTPAGAYGDADRQLQQGQRVQDCMRDKGYTLKSG